MATVTAKGLKRLKKAQLLHLLIDVMGVERVDRLWRQNRRAQAQLSRNACWDCNAIQARLEKEEQK